MNQNELSSLITLSLSPLSGWVVVVSLTIKSDNQENNTTTVVN